MCKVKGKKVRGKILFKHSIFYIDFILFSYVVNVSKKMLGTINVCFIT